jgi:hypothetical protein
MCLPGYMVKMHVDDHVVNVLMEICILCSKLLG